MSNVPDHLRRVPALKLAERINGYWATLGYDADAHVLHDRPDDGDDRGVYVIRSSLRSGLPTRRLDGGV